MLLLALLGATLFLDFEGAHLGPVRQKAENWLECSLVGDIDQNGRNRQASWYYFRLEATPGEEVIIDLVDLPGEYDYRPNRGPIDDRTPPVVSYDQVQWQHLETVEYDPSIPRLRIRLRPQRSPVWVAHVPPYTSQDLARLLKELSAHPNFTVQTIGKSVWGRDLLLLTVTDQSSQQPKKVIWLMARQHSWESPTSYIAEGALRFLLGSSEEAAEVRRRCIFKILPMADPDGVVRGGVRFNVYGYDLNRNWDLVDPVRMPEIAAQRRAILEWVDQGHPIDLLLTLHNTEVAEYLEGPPGNAWDQLLQRLEQLLVARTSFLPTRPARHAPEIPAGQPGRMTVVQGLYRDRKIPAFLLERRISYHPKLGRLPGVGDWLEFGQQLVPVLAEAVEAAR